MISTEKEIHSGHANKLRGGSAAVFGRGRKAVENGCCMGADLMLCEEDSSSRTTPSKH